MVVLMAALGLLPAPALAQQQLPDLKLPLDGLSKVTGWNPNILPPFGQAANGFNMPTTLPHPLGPWGAFPTYPWPNGNPLYNNGPWMQTNPAAFGFGLGGYGNNPWQNAYASMGLWGAPPFGAYQYYGYGNFAPVVGVNNGWFPYEAPWGNAMGLGGMGMQGMAMPGMGMPGMGMPGLGMPNGFGFPGGLGFPGGGAPLPRP
jgi:hypothetical protein